MYTRQSLGEFAVQMFFLYRIHRRESLTRPCEAEPDQDRSRNGAPALARLDTGQYRARD